MFNNDDDEDGDFLMLGGDNPSYPAGADWPPPIQIAWDVIILKYKDQTDIPDELVQYSVQTILSYLRGFTFPPCTTNTTPSAPSNPGTSSTPGDSITTPET